MLGLEYIMLCAPNVAPQTIQQIVSVESKGNPLAINVNGLKDDQGRTIKVTAKDATEAAKLAQAYIAKGYSVDLGLMQVNSRNLPKLGYRVEDMFEPCKNIAAGGRVLTAFYAGARKQYSDEQTALRAALSAYNTGNFVNGYLNGYLAMYGIGSAKGIAPARVPALNPYTADTAVFVRQLQQQKEQAMSTKLDPSGQTALASGGTESVAPVVSRSTADFGTPGVQVEYTHDQAEANGAFHETAMSESEAWKANADVATDPNGTAIIVNGRPVNREGR